MAKKQKKISPEVIDAGLLTVQNEEEVQEVLQSYEEEKAKHFPLYVERKDVGLNVLNHWNIGYDDAKSKKWINSIIQLINDAPNAMVIATNIFTPIVANCPADCLSYEEQTISAIKILSQIKNKPVLLWPGKQERNIFRLTNCDIMKLLSGYLQGNPNIMLIEELRDAKNPNEAIMFVDLHLKNDFVKDPVITLELRDYSTVARTVKSAASKVRALRTLEPSDFIIDLAVLQNAKIFPNLLCVGPVCDQQYNRNIKKTELALNNSYFKLEIKKNSAKNGLISPKGYTAIALKCDYAFDSRLETRKDRNNITANICIEKLGDVEESVFFEILNYYMSKKDGAETQRREQIQAMLDYKKDRANELAQEKKSKKPKVKIVSKKQSKPTSSTDSDAVVIEAECIEEK